MEDFNNYAKNTGRNTAKTKAGAGNIGTGNTGAGNQNAGGLFETVSKIAKNFDGKNQNDLLRAIYSEAEKGKRAGTLTNAEIDGFVTLLSPALDEKKRKYLRKIAEELKKI